MKAFVYYNYGPPEVLEQKDILKPIPKKDELLIKVYASSVSAGISYLRMGEVPGNKLFTFILRLQFGINKPKRPILGCEFSGIIEAVGKNVQRFKEGDAVYGTTTGLENGAYGDYVCVPEKRKQGVISHKPAYLSFAEAAALPVGGMTALQILQKANLSSKTNLLVYGASGSVGSYAVQIAKYFGAKVTAVCSTNNLEWVKSLSADEVMDYTVPEWYRAGKKFDIVFDAVGKLETPQWKILLAKGGKFCSIRSLTFEKNAYLALLEIMIAEDKLNPVIDKVYPFDDMVEAHRYADLGHKKGNVVISHIPDTT